MTIKSAIIGALLCGYALGASAHFGMLIPNHATVSERNQANLELELAFAHPMERNGMTMVKPNQFFVVADGKKTDLTASLKPAKRFGEQAWKADYKIRRPGVYQFVVDPVPYWEPAENKFIVHYTKVVVPAFGDEDGWDAPSGAPAEIIPLTRPFANYAGNTFQGRVMLNGKPTPNADVEVEYFNADGAKKAPNDYFVTQVVKTDADGVFTFTAPWAGWWGFAALNDADYTIKHDGKDKDVEIGAVLWCEFTKPLSAK